MRGGGFGNSGALTWDFPEHRVAHEALEALGVEAGPVHGHRVLGRAKKMGFSPKIPGIPAGEEAKERGLGRNPGNLGGNSRNSGGNQWEENFWEGIWGEIPGIWVEILGIQGKTLKIGGFP